MAKDIATARRGAKVLGLGSVDVRNIESLQAAVDKCVGELGAIDFVMYVSSPCPPLQRLFLNDCIVLERQATS